MKHYTQILKSQARAIELFFLLVAAAGILAYQVLPIDVYPELSFPRIAVIAEAGDMSPERVVVAITRPLEQAVGQVYNVRWIRSRSIRGAAEINADFQEGTNMQYALQQLQARVAEIRTTLPANTNLTIERVTPALFPVITYNISSSTLTQADLWYQANYVIKPAITRVPGVARVIAQGGETQQVSVQVDPIKMIALKVSLSDICDALQKSTQMQVLGKFNRDYQLNLVVARQDVQNLSQLGNVVIGQAAKDLTATPVPAGEPGSGKSESATMTPSAPIFLHDVATISWGVADKTQVISVDGRLGVALSIFRQPNSNVVAVSKGVKAALASLQKHLPLGLDITLAYDESNLVTDAINNVKEAILGGIVMIVIVLYLFLRQWRSTLIAAFTIPISVLAVFGILKVSGQSLNLMSLGGLAVAIGLIIDDAVVVIENIDHQMKQGQESLAAVSSALSELVVPVVSSTVTTVVVFLPLGLLSGVAGQFFSSFSLTLTVAVLFSLLLSLTLTPMLAVRWLKNARLSTRAAQRSPNSAEQPATTSFYARLLRQAFARPIVASLLALALLGASVFLSRNLGTDFLPAVDEGSYMLDYLAPAGSSLVEADSVARTLEHIIARSPEVRAVTRRTGAENGLFATVTNKGDIVVVLKPSSERHRTIWQIMDEQREAAAKLLPNTDTDFHQFLQDELNDLSGVESPVTIKVFGQELPVLRGIGEDINAAIAHVPGLVDLIVSGQAGAPETDIKVDAARASRIGLTAQDVITQVQDALLGGIPAQIRSNDRLIDVRVRLNDSIRKDPAELQEIPITGGGHILPLSALATIAVVPGESEITRENQQRYISVRGNVEGRDFGSVIKDIQAKLPAIAIPVGYSCELGGTYESQKKAFSQLLLILGLAVVLVYFVLLVQFRSWLQPVTIFTAVPLSLFGVLAALRITDTSLNVSSFMGIILLVGLVVKNGIILIDFTNRLLERGMSLEDALIEAGSIRLRPILMTTLCTILGLLPLALGLGSGSELQKPLAIAVIGGLSLSTLFTLVFMPVVFRALVRLSH